MCQVLMCMCVTEMIVISFSSFSYRLIRSVLCFIGYSYDFLREHLEENGRRIQREILSRIGLRR